MTLLLFQHLVFNFRRSLKTLSPLLSTAETTSGVPRLPGTRETWTYCSKSNDMSERWWMDRASVVRREAERAGGVSCSSVLCVIQARLLSVVPNDRKGIGTALKYRIFHFKHEKKLFLIHEGGWTLQQVAQRMPLKIFKTCSDMVLGNPLKTTLLWASSSAGFSPEVPANLSHSVTMLLWNTIINKLHSDFSYLSSKHGCAFHFWLHWYSRAAAGIQNHHGPQFRTNLLSTSEE